MTTLYHAAHKHCPEMRPPRVPFHCGPTPVPVDTRCRVWAPADGFVSYHLPAPTGKNDRYLGVRRGTVTSREQARTVMNAMAMTYINAARTLGQRTHETYFRLSPPDAPESLELLAVETWTNLVGAADFYAQPDSFKGYDGLFTAQPWTAIMQHPAGE